MQTYNSRYEAASGGAFGVDPGPIPFGKQEATLGDRPNNRKEFTVGNPAEIGSGRPAGPAAAAINHDSSRSNRAGQSGPPFDTPPIDIPAPTKNFNSSKNNTSTPIGVLSDLSTSMENVGQAGSALLAALNGISTGRIQPPDPGETANPPANRGGTVQDAVVFPPGRRSHGRKSW